MSTPVKKHTPKIGEVYVARADIQAISTYNYDSYVEKNKMVTLPTREYITKDTHVLLLDVCLQKDVFPALVSNAVMYKVLSLDLKQTLYVKVHQVAPGRDPDVFDYKAAIHSWFLQFNEM